MKNLILALFLLAIAIPTLTAQPAGYDENFQRIGESHNQAIKDALEKLSSHPTIEELIKVLDAIVRKDDPETQFYNAYKNNSDVRAFTDGYLTTKDQAGFIRDYLSPQATEHYNAMMKVLEIRNLGQLNSRMQGVINNIIADESLETGMKNALLYGASTGLNSASLWYGEEGALVWRNSKSAPPEANLATSDDGILKSDATGAVAGAVVGGIAGAGFGAPVTATGGAIMLGAGGSVKTGLGKLWDWAFGD